MKEKNIHIYSSKNEIDKVESYIKDGGDIDSLGEYDSTPLHYACREGNFEIVKLLVKHGADVNRENRYSTIYPIFDILSSIKAKESLPLILFLIESGADIMAVDSFGNTILHYAIEQEMIELIKLSIEFGCDINYTKRDDKDTPLHYSCFQKNREIIYFLIKHGADRNRLNIYNKTPESYL